MSDRRCLIWRSTFPSTNRPDGTIEISTYDENGAHTGPAKLTWANGAVREGRKVNGKWEGEVIYTYAEGPRKGKKDKEVWSNGQVVSTKKMYEKVRRNYFSLFRFFLKKWAFPGLFFFIFSSFQNTVDSKKNVQYIIKFLRMTGFELRTSGIGSNRSTNWATTTAHIFFGF